MLLIIGNYIDMSLTMILQNLCEYLVFKRRPPGKINSPIWIFILHFLISSINNIPLTHGVFVEKDARLMRTRGDIILGGIFPMHEHNPDNPDYPCGKVKEEKGIQRLEAMLFAIDSINNDDTLLPNVTLGALIIDSCSSDTYALEQSMEFVRYYMNQDMSEYKCENGKAPTFVKHKPVAGVIGASFSVVSIMVANILRLFKIPQISYASTSTELSDKSRFEYFSRVVPPDNFQAQAMADLVKQLNWRYASTLAVEGEYGEKGISSFISIAANLGICIAVSEKVSRNAKSDDFDRIIEHLSSKPQARVVVMFVDEDNVRKLLQASIKANKTNHFIWVASDSWGAKVYPVRDQEFAAVNAITVLPHRTNLDDFDRYYKSLRPRLKQKDVHCNNTGTNYFMPPQQQRSFDDELIVNCRNIWFREFWSQHNKCEFDKTAYGAKVNTKTSHHCDGSEKIQFEQEGLVPFVVDAVYAIAHAIDNMIKEKCKDIPFHDCEEIQPSPMGYELLKHIHNVSFVGRQNTSIRFNKDGDAYGFYNIYQYQYLEDKQKYDYVPIGTWKERLDLQAENLRWDTGEMPRSICSDPCPVGHVRNYQDQCCWSCVKCREDAYVHNDTCMVCDPGWAPNDLKNGCDKLTPEVIDWLSPWALVPIIFSSIGILFTLFTTAVFIKYNRTPVIMASGRELCYVLLSGILSCYAMSFIILARPTVKHCAILRIGLGISLSICYSAIFTKTNRISRIFNRGVKSVQRPIYTSPLSQIAISFGIVSIQLIGTIGWLVYEKPDIKEIHPYPLTAVLTCRVSTFSLMMSLIYNIILIVLCTLYAFKTRKIPENFNEAKYIGFTMYSTCIVWLAFIPIYFGTNNDYKIQISSLCMCLNISASVELGCLFLPKVYLVIFQPYKNVRPGTNGNQLGASDPNRPIHSMRFAPPKSQTMQSMTSVSKSASSPKTMQRSITDDQISVITPSIEEKSSVS